MAYGGNQRRERPDDSIVLFKNDERRNEKDPTYKGQGKVSGRGYWAAAWVNESRKDGSKYLSIKLKPKEEQQRESYDRQHQEESQKPFHNDEIPF